MIKYIIIFRVSTIVIFLIGLTACQGNKSKTGIIKEAFPEIVVETEEVVYEYENPDNGSHPFWCHGNAILVRNNEEVYISGIETLKQYKPLNNIRWLLFKRGIDSWELQQADEKGRTREPSPIGLLSDGRLLMSVNPTLETDSDKANTLNQPQVLEFSASNLKAPYKTLLPEWIGSPRFSQHSYRTFSIDRENNEFIIFQNIGYTHSEWAYLDRTGKWYTGKLPWDKREDPSIEPYNSLHIRVNYPSVVLKNKELHFFGNSAFNKWSRIQNLEDAKRIGLEDIVGRSGGRIAGGRFRRLYYTWTPDITKDSLSHFIEIANSHENGENLRVLDMWLDPDGIVHMLWLKNPINLEIRDKFFPDIKRVWSINYAQIREGKILLEKALLESGDGVLRTPKNDFMENFSISWGRYQVLPNDRLFVIFHVSGTGKSGNPETENRIMEVHKDGSASISVKIPLEYPMSFFFTATPRGGSLPSATIDMVGQASNDRYKVRYAKIKMLDK